jgi:hypothetical protein
MVASKSSDGRGALPSGARRAVMERRSEHEA